MLIAFDPMGKLDSVSYISNIYDQIIYSCCYLDRLYPLDFRYC
jgi:hypothetical protein